MTRDSRGIRQVAGGAARRAGRSCEARSHTRRSRATRAVMRARRATGGGQRTPSSGWPAERSAAHEVEVEVVDRLAAPRPDVRDDPVAALGDALVPGDLGGQREQPAEERRVGIGQLGGRARCARAGGAARGSAPGARCPGSRDGVVLRDASSTGSRPRRSCRRGSPGRATGRTPPPPGHQRTGFELMRKPMVPTSPAITYEM